MGDFNTGISKTGSRSTSYKTLTSSGFLTDTYVDHIGISTSGEDTRGPHGHSYITGHANTPWERLGYKIDHIFTAPAFNIYNAGIDRSLFWGSTLIDCQDANSAISSTVRAQCRVGSTMRAVTDFNVASDHWAIWADVNRTSCKLSSCAPSK